MPQHVIYAGKAVNAIMLAGVTWLADLAVTDLEAIPKAISELGLPTVFLALTIYALYYTTKALRASEAGRLKDRAEYTDGIRKDAEKAEKSRGEIREAMERQAHAFERMADKLNTFIDLQRKP